MATEQIIAEIVLQGQEQVKRDLEGVSDAVKQVFADLEEQQSQLGKRVAFKEIQAALEKVGETSAKVADKVNVALGTVFSSSKAVSEIQKIGDAFNKGQVTAEKFLSSVKNIAEGLRLPLSSGAVDAVNRVATAVVGMGQAAATAASTGISPLVVGLGLVGGAITGFLGALAAVNVALGTFANNFTEAATAAGTAAAKVGASVENFERMRSTLASAGIGMKEASKGIEDFHKNIEKARTDAFKDRIKTLGEELKLLEQSGGRASAGIEQLAASSGKVGPLLEVARAALDDLKKRGDEINKTIPSAEDAFKQLGVALTDVTGKARDQSKIFDETIRALARVPNEADRMKLAIATLGPEIATKMAPAFRQGIEAIDAFANRLRAAGLEITDAQVKMAQDSEAAMGRVSLIIEKLKEQIGARFTWSPETLKLFEDLLLEWAPTIQRIVTAIADLTNALAKFAVEQFKQAVADVNAALVEFGKVFAALGLETNFSKMLANTQKELERIYDWFLLVAAAAAKFNIADLAKSPTEWFAAVRQEFARLIAETDRAREAAKQGVQEAEKARQATVEAQRAAASGIKLTADTSDAEKKLTRTIDIVRGTVREQHVVRVTAETAEAQRKVQDLKTTVIDVVRGLQREQIVVPVTIDKTKLDAGLKDLGTQVDATLKTLSATDPFRELPKQALAAAGSVEQTVSQLVANVTKEWGPVADPTIWEQFKATAIGAWEAVTARLQVPIQVTPPLALDQWIAKLDQLRDVKIEPPDMQPLITAVQSGVTQADAILDTLGQAVDFSTIVNTAETATSAIVAAFNRVGDAKRQLDRVDDSTEKVADATKELGQAADGAHQSLDDLATAARDNAGAQSESAAATRENVAATAALAAATGTSATSNTRAADASRIYTDSMAQAGAATNQLTSAQTQQAQGVQVQVSGLGRLSGAYDFLLDISGKLTEGQKAWVSLLKEELKLLQERAKVAQEGFKAIQAALAVEKARVEQQTAAIRSAEAAQKGRDEIVKAQMLLAVERERARVQQQASADKQNEIAFQERLLQMGKQGFNIAEQVRRDSAATLAAIKQLLETAKAEFIKFASEVGKIGFGQGILEEAKRAAEGILAEFKQLSNSIRVALAGASGEGAEGAEGEGAAGPFQKYVDNATAAAKAIVDAFKNVAQQIKQAISGGVAQGAGDVGAATAGLEPAEAGAAAQATAGGAGVFQTYVDQATAAATAIVDAFKNVRSQIEQALAGGGAQAADAAAMGAGALGGVPGEAGAPGAGVVAPGAAVGGPFGWLVQAAQTAVDEIVKLFAGLRAKIEAALAGGAAPVPAMGGGAAGTGAPPEGAPPGAEPVAGGNAGPFRTLVTAAEEAVRQIVEKFRTLGQQIAEQMRPVGEAIGQAIEQGINAAVERLKTKFQELVTAAREIGPAFAGSVEQASSALDKLIAKLDQAIQKAKELAAALQSGGAGGGLVTVPGKAGGGLIRGRGTSTSDSILIRASDQEYMVRARAVKYWGLDFMNQINRMQMPRFRSGGLIEQMVPVPVGVSGARRSQSGSGNYRSVNLFLPSGGKAELWGDDSAIRVLTREAVHEGTLSLGRKPSRYS